MEFILSVIICLCVQAVFLKICFGDYPGLSSKSPKSPNGYELEKMNISEDYNVNFSKIKELNFLNGDRFKNNECD